MSKNIENRIKDKSARFIYLLKTEDEINEDIENKVIKSEKGIIAYIYLKL